MDKLLPRVRALIAEALQTAPESITATLAFGDISAWDSMGHMQIMMALEAQFGLNVDADSIRVLTSVPAICECLERARV